ncbi:MAG TPA: AAA family ATPase, partial [Actinoplanes sp.]|nr:AAA family ATPase [Actinoplanes sp.]
MSEFAAGLRLLREKAGSPGYRELAGRAHFSAATLSAAAAGKKLPSLAVTLAYVEACGGDKLEWEQRWQSVAQSGAVDVEPSADQPPPYRGLACFQPDDAPWFFGRDDVVQHLVQRLAQRRLLVVLGPSGVGKSSVLRAGLVPAVTGGALSDGQLWPVVVMTPGADPLQELAVRLASLAGVPAGALLDDWALDPARLHLTVRQVLAARPTGSQLLLVVDQFEEVFTLCDADRRAAWTAALVAATRTPDSRVRVVLGVRADFYSHCLQLPDLVEELRDGQIPVGAMTAGQLREAIVNPAQRAGLMVDGALVTTVVAEVQGRAGALPLVSHVLLEAWRRRRGSTLTVTAYEAAGGVAGAIAQTAERIWTELDDTERRSARDAVLRLVQVGEQGEVTRRRVGRSEFAAGTAVLDRLAAARLVTLDRDTVEITHEALIGAWPRLQAWVDEDRDGIRVHRHLTAAASTWDSLGRDPGDLYRGARLATAVHWRLSRGPALSSLEQEFVIASLAAEQREISARHRRRRLAAAALTMAVVVVTTLAGIAWTQADQVRNERDLAVSRRLIAEARNQLQLDPGLAFLLAEQAYRRHADPDTDAVLRQAAAESRLMTTYADHQAGVTAAVFSPDGRQIASIERNGAVRLQDRAGRAGTSTLRQLSGAYSDVVFSPDGRR